MTYNKLLEKLREYRAERGWDNLEPLDLALSLVLETSELLEQFQWETTSKARGKTTKPRDLEKLADEVGDIIIYLTGFCDVLGIDLIEATNTKLEKVKKKYPVEKLKQKGFYDKQKQKFRAKRK